MTDSQREKFSSFPPIRIFAPFVAIFIPVFAGCSFKVDLIDVHPERKPRSDVYLEIHPAVKRRFLGAPSLTGSPYRVSVTVNNTMVNVQELQLVGLNVTSSSSEEPIYSGKEADFLNAEWEAAGALSGWYPEPHFELQVKDSERVCVEIELRQSDMPRAFSECFRLERNVSKRRMTTGDYLGQ